MLRTTFLVLVCLLPLATRADSAMTSDDPDLGDPDLTEEYRDTAGRILGSALTDDDGWEKLLHLTTAIGHRLSGSTQLEQAIE